MLVNVQVSNGIPVVSSRDVAKSFDKHHRHVLESIRGILNSAENSAQWFFESSYKDPSGKSNTEYLMTRDGFTLLAMGFTGEKALQFKIAYINAFNEMENRLSETQSKQTPITTSTETQAIREAAIWADVLEHFFGVFPPLAKTSAISKVEKIFNVQLDDVKRLLPPLKDPIADLNVTQLGKVFNISAKDMNNLLCKFEYQTKTGKNCYQPTTKGKPFAIMETFSRNGHDGFFLKWNQSIIDDIKKSFME